MKVESQQVEWEENQELKERVGMQFSIPPYLQKMHSKTPSGCRKPQIVLNPIYWGCQNNVYT